MVVFLALANLVVVQYGRGAIRSALDQGARAGALTGSTQACEEAASDVLRQLLGGRMGDAVTLGCVARAGMMTAAARATFESWTAWGASFEVSVSGEAALEPLP